MHRKARFLAACCLGAACALLIAGTAAAAPRVLYVGGAHAKKSNKRCTAKAPCRTIARALKAAHAGARIIVRHGTYHEMVVLNKRIALVGTGSPTIDATGLKNGILVSGTGTERALVKGLVVEHANEEGILVMNTSYVTIEKDVVRKNDLGGAAAKPVGQCAANGPIPGDCGEGLHLMGVGYSTLQANTVTENAGGILLTDETGPTSHNRISKNTVDDNVLDCGITLAGHNEKAVVLATAPGPPTVAALAPTIGGIFDNQVSDNTVDGNGTKGLGAGIGLFGGAPGTAVYNNVVSENTAEGNGLGGVTLHSHAPGQDLSGNSIVGNMLADDGLHGYPTGAPGDEDAGLTKSAAIILFSAVDKLTSTTVEKNQISNDEIGIFTQNVPNIPRSANTFASTVKTPLVQK